MAGKEIHCMIVTPERALLDVKADFVSVPLYDGELGVLPGRAPMIGRLGYGELRIRKGSTTQYLYVDGGFLQVRDDTVTVLTSRAMFDYHITPDAVRQSMEAAQAALKKASGTEAQETHRAAQDKARAQLRIAAKKKS
ncbi:MAG: ATP synthase F1 subunit epsilon [Planctomycetia bacterium]|nr:ATP synthase F1 subunit epsilon [Planctomycetia bacterium]